MNAPIRSLSPIVPALADRSIGALLVDDGKLSLEQAEQILRRQRETGLRFGEAALQLGLLREEELRFALARQFGYPYLRQGETQVSAEVTAAFQPYGPQIEALRALRSQLMLRWFTGDGGRCLAILGPGRGDGRSRLAANLAVMFAQLGERTLLLDADLRHGRLHGLFGLDNRSGLSTLLSGRAESPPLTGVAGLSELTVLPAGPVPPNPQELLGREAFGQLLQQLAGSFDVVVVDTPAGTDYADAQTIAARAGGALMAVRQHRCSQGAVAALGRSLEQLGVVLVGSVLLRH